MSKSMKWTKTEAVVLINGTYSAGFTVEPWAIFFGALFPDMDTGAIGAEITLDDTNYYPILDPADGADAELCANGSDPGWVDFSDWVRFMPDNTEAKIRFTCASQTTKEVTITVIQRG